MYLLRFSPPLQRAYYGKMPSTSAITIRHIVRGSRRCSSARRLPTTKLQCWDPLPKLIFIYSLQLKINNVWFSPSEVSLNQFLVKCFSLKCLKSHLQVLEEKALLEERTFLKVATCHFMLQSKMFTVLLMLKKWSIMIADYYGNKSWLWKRLKNHRVTE